MRISNFKLRITNAVFRFRDSLFLCLIFAFSNGVFGQTLEDSAEIFKRGSVEQKRETLLRIRNLQSVEASRAAVPALHDSSEIVRATAAFSVVFLPTDEAFDNLVPLLADKKPLVRRETAYALGALGNARAVYPLQILFQKDKVPEVRNAAVVALGAIGDASAVAELIVILERKPNVKEDFRRRSAARSIGQIAQIIQTGRKEVVTPRNFSPIKSKDFSTAQEAKLTERFPVFRAATIVLAQTLHNKTEAADTKREAAFALGAIGDESALAILRANTAAEDYYLAEICREALLKFTKD